MRHISIIGAGNIAYRFTQALHESGQSIDYVYNRTRLKAEKLCKYLKSIGSGALPADNPGQLFNSEIIIIAVSDDAIRKVVEELVECISEAKIRESERQEPFPIFLHTSGATDIEVLSPLDKLGYHTGVIYPLMTLSKTKNIDFCEVPFLLESHVPQVRAIMEELVIPFKCDYSFCDSEKRLRMHAAAVFSCNFINYILELAFEVSGNWSTYLLPTTLEMVRKSFLKSPQEMRTGPAVRGDLETISRHLEMLGKLGMKEHEEVYRLLTENIIRRSRSEKK